MVDEPLWLLILVVAEFLLWFHSDFLFWPFPHVHPTTAPSEIATSVRLRFNWTFPQPPVASLAPPPEPRATSPDRGGGGSGGSGRFAHVLSVRDHPRGYGHETARTAGGGGYGGAPRGSASAQMHVPAHFHFGDRNGDRSGGETSSGATSSPEATVDDSRAHQGVARSPVVHLDTPGDLSNARVTSPTGGARVRDHYGGHQKSHGNGQAHQHHHHHRSDPARRHARGYGFAAEMHHREHSVREAPRQMHATVHEYPEICIHSPSDSLLGEHHGNQGNAATLDLPDTASGSHAPLPHTSGDDVYLSVASPKVVPPANPLQGVTAVPPPRQTASPPPPRSAGLGMDDSVDEHRRPSAATAMTSTAADTASMIVSPTEPLQSPDYLGRWSVPPASSQDAFPSSMPPPSGPLITSNLASSLPPPSPLVSAAAAPSVAASWLAQAPAHAELKQREAAATSVELPDSEKLIHGNSSDAVASFTEAAVQLQAEPAAAPPRAAPVAPASKRAAPPTLASLGGVVSAAGAHVHHLHAIPTSQSRRASPSRASSSFDVPLSSVRGRNGRGVPIRRPSPASSRGSGRGSPRLSSTSRMLPPYLQ